MSRARFTIRCTNADANHDRSALGFCRVTKICVTPWSRAKFTIASADVGALQDPRFDVEPAREVEMTLEALALFGREIAEIRGLRHVDREALGPQVVGDAPAPPDQRGARRIGRQHQQQAIAAPHVVGLVDATASSSGSRLSTA